MVGITSIGAYIPMYRLSREELGRFWRAKGIGGEKAVAGYDEDTVTMAVAAAQDCTGRSGKKVSALSFASTTAPYREKQSAAIIASVIGLDRRCATADFSNSLRAGTTALKSALDAVKSGSADQVLVTASDYRTGAPKGRVEQLLGDGAAALMIGSNEVIVDIEGSYSIFNEFTDVWKTDTDSFLRSGEGRFIDDIGYLPTMQEAVSKLMKAYSLRPADFSKIVFSASDSRQHGDLAKKLGFEASQVQDPLFSQIGNSGTAGALLMLVAALEDAKAGDRILFVNYGDGSDAFILRATQAIAGIQTRPMMGDRLARKRSIDYGTYLNWRDLIPLEASNLPERGEPSLVSRWRERRVIASLSGVRCRKCGTPQIHPIGQTIRVCIVCQSKDEFDDYKFSDKKGKLFTYSIDHLQPTKNPPGLNGVVDFDGGGRLICELTDCDLDRVKIGMPVEMTFRKLSQGKGIVNYFWKAKPVIE
ncbi:MAG TPA: hydroxymethylglutaryl-CoA synthase [Thermodesulfobacteriota bacterium]|nr:hydroxymethylglutaryl-CoA synthase [Thermodesulfobacteriota bacterium]